MKLTNLGKMGLAFENEGVAVLVNPSSDVKIHPSVIIITSEGEDVFSESRIVELLDGCDQGVTLLLPESVYYALEDRITHPHNCVLLAPHSVWSQNGITFYSVKAQNKDATAIGVILDDGERTFYVSGCTLYNFDVIDDVLDLVESGVDFAFLPVSGRNNCMNPKDAADFAYEIGAKCAIPVGYDGASAPEEFDFDDAMVIPVGESAEI